jgi:uncharacterized protein (TIGR03663 family)
MAQVQERVRTPRVERDAPIEEPRELTRSVGDWTWLIFAAITAVAFALRLWDLGARAMHHDESLHAVYSWYLYQGRPYIHDPMMHGPFLFHVTALLYLLFGDSEVTARLPMALFGAGAVFLPYFLRHELGRAGAIAASVMLAIGPVFLSFSRFGHNEGMILFQTLLVIVGLFGWLRERKPAYLYAAVIGLGMMFTTKVVVYMFGALLAAFVIAALFVERIRRGEPIVMDAVRDVGLRRLGVCAAIVLGMGVVLYTTFFSNLEGLCTAIISPPIGSCATKQGMLQYWHDQQGVARGSQPWFYYFMLLPLYEIVPVVLAFAALFVARRPRSLFFWFSIWWALSTLAIYTYASEKMPWLVIHSALPLVILGAQAVDPLADRLRRPWGLTPRQWSVSGLVLLGITVFIAWATVSPEAGASALGAQTARLRQIALAVVLGSIAIGVVLVSGKLRIRQTFGAAALSVLLMLGVYWIHSSWQASYKNGDIPVEMIVYVQSSPDIPFIVNEIERISNQLGLRKDIPLLLDGGYTETVAGVQVPHEAVSWPFEWYFRDYKAKQYFTKNLPADFATGKWPVVIAMGTNLDPIRDDLTGYTGNRYKLNWWYPEDYKQLVDGDKPWDLKWGTIFGSLIDAESRSKLVKYVLYRDLVNPPLGGRELFVYTRNDLVGLGGAGVGAAPVQSAAGAPAPAVGLPAQQQPAVAQSVVRILSSYSGTGGQALREPKGVAVGPDGNVYVTDIATSVVTVFNQNGAVVRSWGRKGAGDGEFNEPWGIAVGADGSVFVADTWNHRIQKFDADGRFVTKWGIFEASIEPYRFYGPRDVAIGPNGDVLVADTGNKRIQVFDQDGAFKSVFGSEGSAPGQFREPVGVTVGRDGRIYVADTWNNRIQVFDPTFKPIAQYPVQGWDSQSVANKPYVAVAGDGTIFATVPERRQVLRLSDGAATALGLPREPRLQMPVGIEVQADDRLLVVDSQASIVVAYGVSSPGASSGSAGSQPAEENTSNSEAAEPAGAPAGQ